MNPSVVSSNATPPTKPKPEINNEPLVIGIIGPWGAGKTSMLNDLERRYAPDPERVGIIFAEFGEANVDAARIQGRRVIEVKDRCICCQGAEALAEGIQSLRGSVDLILVETSGVSNGGNVRQVFSAMGLRFSILGVVNSAEFSRDDTEILDSQLPATDAIVLTHQYWLGEEPSLADPRLESLRDYVRETTGRDPDDFASRSFGLSPETYFKVVARACEPVELSSHDLAQRTQIAAQTRHQQALLTLVLHDGCDAAQLEEGLRSSPVRIKRAKGVVGGEDGRPHEFDFVPGRSDSDSEVRTMKFIMQEEDSRSKLFRGRSHAVLCSMNSLGSLSYEQFLGIGLPDLSDTKLVRAFSRYPGHRETLSRGKTFPVYNKEGDRFYGALYPIRERILEIPSAAARDSFTNAWKRTLDAYLSWRADGLEFLKQTELPSGQTAEANNLLSLNVLWHMLNLGEDLSPTLKNRLQDLKPASIFFESCLKLDRPPESGQSRELTSDTASMLVQFGRYATASEGVDPRMVVDSLRHSARVDSTGTWSAGLSDVLEQLGNRGTNRT